MSNKLGVNVNVLKKTLWGDFYLHSKTKRIMKGAQEKAKKPIFVQMILENIWLIYDVIINQKVNYNNSLYSNYILTSYKLSLNIN